jgi:predicted transcriptional regulator
MTITQNSTCKEDDLEITLLNHNENLASIQKSMQSLIPTLKAKAEEVETSFLAPFEDNLARILSQTGFTVDEMANELGLLSGTSKEDNERYMKTRYGVSIVNGRFLVPGDINLVALKELRRLVGSIEKVEELLPELNQLGLTDSYSLTPIASRFIFLITKVEDTEVEDTKCRAGYSISNEVLIGTNVSIASILKSYPDLKREDLILYLFWVGDPVANKSTKKLATQYGLTTEEFAYAVANLSINNLNVYVISNPIDFLKIKNKYGSTSTTTGTTGTSSSSDADKILDRGPDTLNIDPDPETIISYTDKIIAKQPGAKTTKGAEDYSSGPINLYNTIDVDKTFGVTENLIPDPCLDLTSLEGIIDEALLNADKVMRAVTSAINTPQKILNNVNNKVADIARPVLNKLTKLISIASDFLGDPDFLKCYLGSSFSMALDLGAVLGPLNKLMDLLGTGASLIYDFLDIIINLLTLLGQVACIQGSLSDAFNAGMGIISNLTAKFGLHCTINAKPDFGECFQKGINIAQYAANFLNNLLASLLFNLRSLQMFISNLQVNLKGAIETSSVGSICNPAETALLTAVLTKLGLASDQAPIGL